jgi:DNA-binding SARP family transcriptional activator
LTTPAGEVGINPTSDFWLDVANFESNTRKVTGKTIVSMDADDAAELENALQLYSGDLLEGIYDDWVLLERERLRSLYFKSLIQLMRYKKQVGALDESIIHAQQILCLDPIREEIHRELMRLYVENGQRSLALRHYKNCRKILQEELSIPPMRETQELYREILQSASADQGTLTSRTSFPTNPVQEAGSIEISQQFFFQILQSLEKLAKQQQRTNQLLDHLIKNH